MYVYIYIYKNKIFYITSTSSFSSRCLTMWIRVCVLFCKRTCVCLLSSHFLIACLLFSSPRPRFVDIFLLFLLLRYMHYYSLYALRCAHFVTRRLIFTALLLHVIPLLLSQLLRIVLSLTCRVHYFNSQYYFIIILLLLVCQIIL